MLRHLAAANSNADFIVTSGIRDFLEILQGLMNISQFANQLN